MTGLNLARAIVLTVAEVAGAYWFFKTRSAGLRILMTSFGFGFALAIVLFDLLPDATEHYAMGYPLFALGALVMLGVWSVGKRKSQEKTAKGTGSVAVTGMALHNLGEGILLAAMTGPISFLLFAGALLHKLPEGMATFALLDGVREKTRFALAASVGLMIPLGALLRIPISFQQPVMALLAGMILVAVSTAILEQSVRSLAATTRWRFAMPCLMGAVIGGVSCLIA
jgi:ZIP family zinc transporter